MPLPLTLVFGQVQLSVSAQVPIAYFWPPLGMVYCEFHRVDCNTLEILE